MRLVVPMVLLWTMGMMKVSVPQVMDSWLRTSCCGVKANRGAVACSSEPGGWCPLPDWVNARTAVAVSPTRSRSANRSAHGGVYSIH